MPATMLFESELNSQTKLHLARVTTIGNTGDLTSTCKSSGLSSNCSESTSGNCRESTRTALTDGQSIRACPRLHVEEIEDLRLKAKVPSFTWQGDTLIQSEIRVRACRSSEAIATESPKRPGRNTKGTRVKPVCAIVNRSRRNANTRLAIGRIRKRLPGSKLAADIGVCRHWAGCEGIRDEIWPCIRRGWKSAG